MGDDVDAPHSYSFSVSANSSLQDVFDHLAGERYLPTVSGKNHSWEAVICRKPLVFYAGNNQYPEPSEILSTSTSQYVKNGTLEVRYRYNSATT